MLRVAAKVNKLDDSKIDASKHDIIAYGVTTVFTLFAFCINRFLGNLALIEEAPEYYIDIQEGLLLIYTPLTVITIYFFKLISRKRNIYKQKKWYEDNVKDNPNYDEKDKQYFEERIKAYDKAVFASVFSDKI